MTLRSPSLPLEWWIFESPTAVTASAARGKPPLSPAKRPKVELVQLSNLRFPFRQLYWARVEGWVRSEETHYDGLRLRGQSGREIDG
ncbi:hypothetical protein MPLA_270017 [Mesorhizobium sp. ORS 3359]|nr:hypothetical protein MPLA_270017 [Mesorhizobium sp. ORS 3359]